MPCVVLIIFKFEVVIICCAMWDVVCLILVIFFEFDDYLFDLYCLMCCLSSLIILSSRSLHILFLELMPCVSRSLHILFLELMPCVVLIIFRVTYIVS